VTQLPSGEPPISFLVHQIRAGNEAGARVDFEHMLSQLVAVAYPRARMVAANPGDWGIDVLVGDLAGRVTIWQAKYFLPAVVKRHREQIERSFGSAMRAAAQNGYRVDRWVLCVPASMDAAMAAWWDRWKAARQAADAVQIELWDETLLRGLLTSPHAAHVRRHYYDPYTGAVGVVDPDTEAALLRQPNSGAGDVQFPVAQAPPDSPWRGGDERSFGSDCYLIHDQPSVKHSADHAWMWQEGTADQIEPRPGRVWLRQLHVLRGTAAAEERRAALRAQARLLAGLEGVTGLPRLLDVYEEPSTTTVVTAQPPGPTWRGVYGPAATPLDRITAASALGAMASLCAALAELHRRGHSHRALTPDAILLVDRSRRAVLRDIGLAGVPPAAGEGPPAYRSAEQTHPLGRGAIPGQRTDVYQVAAIVYHTMTGHPPVGGGSPPVRAANPDFPQSFDDLLRRALDPDPRQRPRHMGTVAAALRAGQRRLSRGERR
jgi:hypothetical protein